MIKLPQSDSFFLFGPRQTGKTTLIAERFADNCWNINLLFEETFQRYTKQPGLFHAQAIEQIERKGITTILIDEIQRCPPLLNEAQALIDKYPSVRFVLTGSSARKLKRQGVNLLGGRAVERHLFPFTYAEITQQFQLDDVLRFGTLPGIFDREPEAKKDRLNAYVNTYLREEIRQEGIVRNIGGFSRFLDIAASQNSELVNYSDMARECSLSSHTIKAHYEILEDTLIAFALLPWIKSTRRRMASHPKYYFFDLGVLNALNHRLDAEFDPRLRGRLFETLIVLELHRRLHYSRSEALLYFWRTSNGAEVDIIVEKHGRLIAACEIKTSKVIDRKQLSGLLSFREDNQNVPCFVASTIESAYTQDGIRIAPWYEIADELALLF